MDEIKVDRTTRTNNPVTQPTRSARIVGSIIVWAVGAAVVALAAGLIAVGIRWVIGA